MLLHCFCLIVPYFSHVSIPNSHRHLWPICIATPMLLSVTDNDPSIGLKPSLCLLAPHHCHFLVLKIGASRQPIVGSEPPLGGCVSLHRCRPFCSGGQKPFVGSHCWLRLSTTSSLLNDHRMSGRRISFLGIVARDQGQRLDVVFLSEPPNRQIELVRFCSLSHFHHLNRSILFFVSALSVGPTTPIL